MFKKGKHSDLRIEQLKKGKRTYGCIVEWPDGRRCYLAYRRHGEIFRMGCKSITEAIRTGVASWAIDIDTLVLLRSRKINAVGVLVRETQDVYMTDLATFQDPKKAKVMNYASRGGSLQKYLPLQYFQKRPGSLRL